MSTGAQAYARTVQTSAPAREVEAQAILKAARQLQEVQSNWAGMDQRVQHALLFNRQLWSQDPGTVIRRGIERIRALAGD